MATGTHRKGREIPWGYITGGLALFLAAVSLLVAVSWLGTPTYAHAAARPAKAVTVDRDPFWDGKHPKVWTGYRDPRCTVNDAHHIAPWMTGGELWWAECLPFNPGTPEGKGDWYWTLITP